MGARNGKSKGARQQRENTCPGEARYTVRHRNDHMGLGAAEKVKRKKGYRPEKRRVSVQAGGDGVGSRAKYSTVKRNYGHPLTGRE